MTPLIRLDWGIYSHQEKTHLRSRVNEVPIVEKGHIARHPYIYTTLVAVAVFLSSTYLRSELNADMLIDEYVWYSQALHGGEKIPQAGKSRLAEK
jgi:hypothetical protein